MRYSTSNNGVPLKSELKVIDNGTFGYSMYDFLLSVQLYYIVPFLI